VQRYPLNGIFVDIVMYTCFQKNDLQKKQEANAKHNEICGKLTELLFRETKLLDQKFIIPKTGGKKSSAKKLAENEQNFCGIRYVHVFDTKWFRKTTRKD